MLIGCCARILVFTLHLSDNMANVSVYGVAMAADVLANRRTRSPNIFGHTFYSFTLIVGDYCIII